MRAPARRQRCCRPIVPTRYCGMRTAAALCALLFLFPATGWAQSISPREAARHVGQSATVCGLVASTRYASRSRGRPTFLNFGRPYPYQEFTVVIWGSDRARFGQPEITDRDKRVCATGEIRLYRRKPEMVVREPSELRPDDGHASYPAPSGTRLHMAPSE